MKAVGAGLEVRIDGLARRDGLAPIPVKAVEPVPVPDALGDVETQAHEAERDSASVTGYANRPAHVNPVAVGRDAFDVNYRRHRVVNDPRRVDDREAVTD